MAGIADATGRKPRFEKGCRSSGTSCQSDFLPVPTSALQKRDEKLAPEMQELPSAYCMLQRH